MIVGKNGIGGRPVEKSLPEQPPLGHCAKSFHDQIAPAPRLFRELADSRREHSLDQALQTSREDG
jgi:hypothetical protein